MIGSGLKKLAIENGMKIDKGVAYGALRGYSSTMFDGSGTKTICISTVFTDPLLLNQLQAVLNTHNLMKEFRITSLSFTQKQIIIIFHDNPGTMKKITAFIEWFFPLLSQHGATGADICPECCCELTGGVWKLIDGTAHRLHEACAEKVKNSLAESAEAQAQEAEGSYLGGFFGAVIGAALGGIVWALLLTVGYVASLVGLLIGWLSEKGYTLLRGKNGKGKIFILIIAVIFGVLFGTLAGDCIGLIQMINNGELPGITYADIPYLFVILFEDSAYLAATGKNVALGLFFAALGVFSFIRRRAKEIAPSKIVDLK